MPDAPSLDPLNATLLERRDLTDELAVFRVRPEGPEGGQGGKGGEAPRFTPGQYTTLGVLKPESEWSERARKNPKAALIRRAYSIASSPNEREALEFFLVVVQEGALTPRLWDLHEGDRLFMDNNCKGTFTLDGVPEGKDLVMIATGTGLAPFVSMLRTYSGQGRWERLVIIHGTRLARDLAYRDEFERAAEADPSVIYIPMCTREPSESNWSGLRGRIHVALEPGMYARITGGRELSPQTTHLFLCGNPAMIDDVERDMTARGFSVRDRSNPGGNIHFERYW